jgi:hypothetical protein
MTEYHPIQQNPCTTCTVTFAGGAFWNSTLQPNPVGHATSRSSSWRERNPRTAAFIQAEPPRNRPSPRPVTPKSLQNERPWDAGASRLHISPISRETVARQAHLGPDQALATAPPSVTRGRYRQQPPRATAAVAPPPHPSTIRITPRPTAPPHDGGPWWGT